MNCCSHLVSIEEVLRYGGNETVLLSFIRGEIDKAISGEEVFTESRVIDGRVWVKLAAHEIESALPIWNKEKIYRYLRKLIKMGALDVGKYGKSGYEDSPMINDRWYAIKESQTIVSLKSDCSLTEVIKATLGG